MEDKYHMSSSKTINTQKLVFLAILTAIVIALQLLGAFIRFGQFSITLVLMPIAIGAALLGIIAGAWLGLVFGFVVLLTGDAGVFLAIDPAATVIVVLLKGALAGLGAGCVYKLLEKHNKMIAAVAAAIVCPIINTGIFIIGSYLFFIPTITEWANAVDAASVTAFIFFGLIGANFLLELVVNIVLSPTVVRLIQYWNESKQPKNP